MATNSNSDQGKIDNNELEVIETNKSSDEMMRDIGISIGALIFEPYTIYRGKTQYDEVAEFGKNNPNTTSSSDTTSSGNGTNGGGKTSVVLTDNMENVIKEGLSIAANPLNNETKAQIKKKAEKSTKQTKDQPTLGED